MHSCVLQASVNVSVVEETVATSVDMSSLSERSREQSAASASTSDANGCAEGAVPSLAMDATQYGDVSMDITACSMSAGADDTLAFFEKLERITPQSEFGLISTPQSVSIEVEKDSATQSDDVNTAAADSFTNPVEDTLSVMKLLEQSSAPKVEQREVDLPQELQPKPDSQESFSRQNYQSRRPSNSRE